MQKNIWKSRNFTPMLLKEIDKPFNSKDYIFEIKFDGYRALIFASPKSVKIISRNNIDITRFYPELQKIKELVTKDTIFDGEIIAIENDLPSFLKLQQRSHLKNKNKIDYYAINDPVVFVCFDILYEGKDLTNLKLMERKKILEHFLENEVFIKSKIFLNNGVKLFSKIKKLNLEGIIAKEKDSIYEINKRSDAWLKIKNLKEEEFIIGGYEIKKNNYVSVLLGELKNNKLHYVGKCTLINSNNLYDKIINCKKISSPFCNYNEKNINYITPKLKCKVKYLERTSKNMLRQPIIKKEEEK